MPGLRYSSRRRPFLPLALLTVVCCRRVAGDIPAVRKTTRFAASRTLSWLDANLFPTTFHDHLFLAPLAVELASHVEVVFAQSSKVLFGVNRSNVWYQMVPGFSQAFPAIAIATS